jgi:acetyl esterase/lipase
MDRATRSAAYDNGAAVADSAARVARWRALSASLRATCPGERDLAYGPLPRQRLDLFDSATARAPLVAFIHGGYWQRNAKEDFACVATGPLARGLDVALVGYTLAPEASLTAIVAEIRAALTLLRRLDRERGLARPLVVSGWSAGGHLAALALDWPEVDAALAISGIFDLEPLRGTIIDDKLRLTEMQVEALSPLRRPTRRPIVIACGGDELPELRRQSRDYHAACAATGGAATLCPIEGADHFSVLDGLIEPDGALTRSLLALSGR